MIGTAKEIGVLVVDDNDILGESMRRWVTGTEGVRWLGWTDDVGAAAGMIERLSPDVVLLDVDMPSGDTFELLRRISREQPGVKVVMLSGHMQQDYIEQALDCGASGYIVKDESPATIIDFVRRAAAGEIVLSATAAKRSWKSRPGPPGPPGEA
jgi:DNA-binding NarL/FixJ family response regulator